MEEKKKPIVSSEELEQMTAETVSGEGGEFWGEHHHHHHHHHHSHSHSHSHRGHSRHRTRHKIGRSKGRKSQKNGKVAAFFKQHRSVLVNIASCTVSVLLLILFACTNDIGFKGDVEKDTSLEITQSSIKVESTVYLDEIPLVTQAVLKYLEPDSPTTARDVYRAYNGYNQQLGVGLPVKYSYRVSGIPVGVSVENALLEICDNDSFDDATQYNLDTRGDDIEIYHLIPGTKYHYRLVLTLNSGTAITTLGDFTTKESPRILSIDGVVNVRDIGGWNTDSGKKINYGLLYRGSELDGAVEQSYLITERGLHDMISVLGVRYDMDLRGSHESDADPLGANVLHKFYGIPMYSEILAEGEREKLRDIFSDLANREHYPMYLHCTYGADRTGTICYLLCALLGVSDENLRHDYELTAFTGSYVNIEDFSAFITRISMLEGANTKEKVENYLLSIGVTAEEIETIRNIFLG